MVEDIIRYPGRTRDYQAYVVRPKVSLVAPGVLFLPDRWGPDDVMREYAHKLAHAGYAVMVPDLYNGRRPGADGEAKQWMHRLALKEGQEEVRLALAWLRNQAYVREHETAVIGFEHYGTLALLSGTLERFPPRAVVVFYSPVSDVVRQAGNMRAAVQGHFGERDKAVPSADIDVFRQVLARANIPHDIRIYPNARHDFMRPNARGYDASVARQAWEHAVDFLSKTLA